MILEDLRKEIKPADPEAMELAKRRWLSIGKPLYSLGKLETEIIRIAGIKRIACYELKRKALIVMCADNGIVEEGVSQTGQQVTVIVADNFTRHETSACLMAEVAGVDIYPVDIGMAEDVPSVTRPEDKVAYGTRNFAREPAMTEAELTRAIETGIRIAGEKKREGYDILLTGEMGIGNTTTSSAVAAALLGRTAEEMTGRGAGLTSEGLEKKTRVIREALERYRLRERTAAEVMAAVGGLDLAGMCGLYLGGAMYGIPVVIDGYISAVAALCAARLVPASRDAMIPSHVSGEPGAGLVLEALRLSPLITCGMRLGEGSGAIAAMPLLEMGLKVYNQMKTFEEIQVEQYKELK